MKEALATRLQWNLDRVAHLVAIYSQLEATAAQPSQQYSDVLRAAVVLLHATLEDFLRDILLWKLPTAASEHLAAVPLVGKKNRSSFTLEDLAQHRGSTVDDVILRSVKRHLNLSNFNNPGEIDVVLERIGISTQLMDAYRNQLGPMMTRRHLIVHRADGDDAAEGGQRLANTMDVSIVQTWHDAVGSFGNSVLQVLQPQG